MRAEGVSARFEWQREFVDNGGVRLHFVRRGQGEPIVFLHGFPEFWYAWKPLMGDLGRDFLTVAPDLRGYNASDKPKKLQAYKTPELLSDIECVVDRVAPGEKVTLVGHDWGGVLAWHFAARFPDRLEELVIINAPHPQLFPRTLMRHPLQMLSSSYILLFRTPWLAEQVLSARDYALLRRGVFEGARTADAFRPIDRLNYLKAWAMPGALTGGLNYYRAISTWDWVREREREREVTVPTLVLWAEDDLALRTSNLEGLGRWVPNLQIVRIPEATHWVVHEKPKLIAQHIRRFLGKPRKEKA